MKTSQGHNQDQTNPRHRHNFPTVSGTAPLSSAFGLQWHVLPRLLKAWQQSNWTSEESHCLMHILRYSPVL